MSDKRRKKLLKKIMIESQKKDQKVAPINKQKGKEVKDAFFKGNKASEILRRGLKVLGDKLTPKTIDEKIEEKKKQGKEMREQERCAKCKRRKKDCGCKY